MRETNWGFLAPIRSRRTKTSMRVSSLVLIPSLANGCFSHFLARSLEPYVESVLDHFLKASSPSKKISWRVSSCFWND